MIMEIETLNTKTRSKRKNQTHIFPDIKSDLASVIENMKHSHSWLNGELISMILLNRADRQILLTALHTKTEVYSFQSKDSVTIQIIEGKLKFYTRKESAILIKGQILTLNEKIEYSLTAIEETVFLLTISPTSLNKQKSK
jgi:hypothetical protein